MANSETASNPDSNDIPVDDEAAEEGSSAGNYIIDSYGADYTVDSLVNRMNKSAFIVPEFQRRFVWSQKHASRFIESLLMGLPVPGIFLYKRSEDSKHLVIDGQQRLRSLQSYYSGTFKERKFRLSGVREPWVGKTYNELDANDQLRLDDSIVHTTIFSQKSPVDEIASIHFVFERINSGGIRLSAQEIRNCISAGPFTKTVRKLNDLPDWREIYGPESLRSKDEELILRSIALFDDADNYIRPMSTFLTRYADNMNKKSQRSISKYSKLFSEAAELVNRNLGSKAFRPVRSLNAAVLDSIMAALMKGVADDTVPTDKQFVLRYTKLLKDDLFGSGWLQSTADEDAVRIRIDRAEEILLRKP